MGKKSTASRVAFRAGQKPWKASRMKISNKATHKSNVASYRKKKRGKTNEEENADIERSHQKNLQGLSWNHVMQNQPLKRPKKSPEPQPQISSKRQLDTSTYDRFMSDTSSDDEDEDLGERPFEKQMRAPSTWQTEASRMPIISESGEWTNRDRNQGPDHLLLSDDDGDVEMANADVNEMLAVVGDTDARALTEEKEFAHKSILKKSRKRTRSDPNSDLLEENNLRLRKRMRLRKMKSEIASIGGRVLEDPHRHIGLLQLLLPLCSDPDVSLRQVAMLSLTRAIQDIMPPYRIGTMQEGTKLKKQNQAVRAFENKLLEIYRKFLKLIFKASRIYHAATSKKTERKDPKRFIVARCAIKCIVVFVSRAGHFNYAKELIKAVIPLMNSPNSEIRHQCCDAMGNLLSQSPVSNATVEAVKSMCVKMDQRNYNVYPEMLSCFVRLPIRDLEPEDPMNEDDELQKPTLSKLEKKLEAQITKEMRELEGLNAKKLLKRQRMVIENVCAAYFYTLKLDVSPGLLAVCLEGLSHFSHLINIELVVNLVAVVSERLESHELSMESKLHCVATAFGCMTRRGTSIEMDVKQYYVVVYQALMEVRDESKWFLVPLISKCLEMMFGRSNFVPIDRVAAFVKRLALVAVHLPSHYSLAFLHFARKMVRSDPRLNNMLEVGGGFDQVFRVEAENPDQANALAACLWELTLTSSVCHPFLADYSRDFASWSEIGVGVSTASPMSLCEEFDCSGGSFDPPVSKSKRTQFSVHKNPPVRPDVGDLMATLGNRNAYQPLGNSTKLCKKLVKQQLVCGRLQDENSVLGGLRDQYLLFDDVVRSTT